MAGDDIPIRDRNPRPPTSPPSGSPPPSRPSTTTTTPGGGGGGGGGGYDARAAERRAIARENELRRKAGLRYEQAAIDLGYQIRAFKDLIKNELKRARNQNLRDIDLLLGEQLGQLKLGARQRGAQFLTAAEDNAKAAGGILQEGFVNATRESAEIMTSILEQGAGETDAMRAMMSAARNWHSNASEANRSYFDTQASINQGITDLNIDTRTAMANAQMTAEGQRESVWQDFYNRRAEAMTNLGNLYGQRADYMEQAKEMGIKMNSTRTSRLRDSRRGMKKYFQASADELGKSYEQKGLPKWIKEWEGTEQVERRQTNTQLAAAMTFEPVKRAEGATLRTWAE